MRVNDGVRTAVAIVNYNSWSSLRAMLASMVDVEPLPDIYVVDNASDSPAPLDLIGRPPVPFRLIRLSANLGYTGAASAFLDSNGTPYDWVFIANPDLVFVDKRVFSNLEQLKHSNFKMPGIYAPRVIDQRTGRNLNPHRKYPLSRLQYLKYRLITSTYPTAAAAERCSQFIRGRPGPAPARVGPPEQVFAVHGSFFGVSANFARHVGVNTGAFLFCEEEILGFMCRDANFDVIYDPSVSILHEGHVTTGFRYSRFRHRHRRDSLRLLRRYL